MTDTRFDRSIENEKMHLEKKVPITKSLQAVGQKNLKTIKEQVKTKNETKREVENKDLFLGKFVEMKSSKGQIKVRRTESRVNSASIRTVEERPSSVKSRNLMIQKIEEGQKIGRPPSAIQDRS